MCGLQAGLSIIPLIPIGRPCTGGRACWARYQLQTGEHHTMPTLCAKPPASCLADCARTGGSPARQAAFVIWHPVILEATSSGLQLSKGDLHLQPTAAGTARRSSFARPAKCFTTLQKHRNKCCLGQHEACDWGMVGGERKKWNKNLWSGNKWKRVPDKGDRFPYCYTTVSQATSPVSVFPFGSGW